MTEPSSPPVARRGNAFWLSVASLLNDAASETVYPLLPLVLPRTIQSAA